MAVGSTRRRARSVDIGNVRICRHRGSDRSVLASIEESCEWERSLSWMKKT